jgi:hypothetical protein
VGIYLVDILNKGMKPFGYACEKFPNFSGIGYPSTGVAIS